MRDKCLNFCANPVRKSIELIITVTDTGPLFLLFKIAVLIRKGLSLFFLVPFPDNASPAGSATFRGILLFSAALPHKLFFGQKRRIRRIAGVL